MDEEQKREFIKYAKRYRFSDSLIEKCLSTLEYSIECGDGALWTDSLLWTLLQTTDSLTSETLSSSIGIRGDLIQSLTFTETMATQHLVFSPTFQTSVDESLQYNARIYPNNLIDEDSLVLMEVSQAVEDYGHAHTSLVTFAEYLLEPLKDYFFSNEQKIPNKGGIWRFSDRFVDAFILANMAKQHPFDAFTRVNQVEEDSKRWVPIKKKYLIFLYYLRDSVHVSPHTIPDETLVGMSKKWSDPLYEEALNEVNYNMESDDGKIVENTYNSCLYAASQLIAHDVSLPWLLERLQKKEYYNNNNADWPNNEALLLNLSNGFIQVNPTDLLGVQKVCASPLGGSVEHSSAGIIVPSPIWNPTVIDRFEFLINKRNVKESELQTFFEMYPDFILSDLHISATPQVILYRERENKTLRPDFILKRAGTNYVDIVEIKRPVQRIVTGTDERSIPTRNLALAIAQLKQYGDWFKDSSNRRWFKNKYGLDGYEPSLTLIIGRSSGFRNEEIRQRVISSSGVNIFTYDDLLTMSKLRNSKIFGQ